MNAKKPGDLFGNRALKIQDLDSNSAGIASFSVTDLAE